MKCYQLLQLLEVNIIIHFNEIMYFIAPRLNNVSIVNINGNLTVSWSIIHTGGLQLDNITIDCNNSNIVILECYNEECMISDSISYIGPVIAGNNYSCIVNIVNSIGLYDKMRSNYIITNTGKSL